QIFLEVYPHLDIDEIVKSLPSGLSKPYGAYMFGIPGHTNEATFLTVLGAYLCQGSKKILRTLCERYVFALRDTPRLIKTIAMSPAGISFPSWVCPNYLLIRLACYLKLNHRSTVPFQLARRVGNAGFREMFASFVKP